MNYENNLFTEFVTKARVLPPESIVKESEFTLAIYDINPRAKVHILVLPKGLYKDFCHFEIEAKKEEKEDFWMQVKNIIIMFNLQSIGYKLITNSGKHGGQEIPHFHLHLLGGEKLTGLY